MILLNEYLKNGEQFHEFSPQVQLDILDLLIRVNNIRALYGKPLIVTSGFRSKTHNILIGGSPRSAHCEGQAIDIKDTTGELYDFIVGNGLHIKYDLYIEDKNFTKGWCHIQTRKVLSGNRVFIP